MNAMDHCSQSSFQWKVQLLLGMLLILFGLRASALMPASTHHAGDPEAAPNTLVTGVVIYSYDDVLVEIYRGHHCIARTKATCGLFKIDLAGKVAQDELFTVRVRGQVSSHDREWRSQRYLSTRYITDLGDSQNMELEVMQKSKGLSIFRRVLHYFFRNTSRRFKHWIEFI